ncbi:MAG: efflux RND transporter permease subunit [Candidatus Binatia bacterium]|nr:efflux RND transporter permease subunit [Candidatus Binatia bacterium]
MGVSDLAIRRPVLTLVVVFVLALFGLTSYPRLGVDLWPEVDWPMVTVTTFLQGASPETVESEVTEPLEERINEIGGVKHITSVSALGVSQVMVEFELYKDVDVAAQEVRDKVSVARRDLPEDIEPPIIDKLDINAQPFMWIAIVSDTLPYTQISQYADKVLKRRLQTAAGVGAIEIAGFREREVKVWLDRDKLNAYALTALDVTEALRREHIEVPAGRVETGPQEFLAKTMGEFPTPEAFNDLIVAFRDGTPIRLRDIGYAAEGFDEQERYRTIARFQGRPAVGLGIKKQSGTNTVAVSAAVKKRLEELRPTIPPGIEVVIGYDAADFIQQSVLGAQRDLFFGAMLTVLTMFLFLRSIRPTVVATIIIPTTLIGTFAAMYFFGFTLNNLTLLALTISVGMIIDDTIVVIENVFRHLEEGKKPLEAARAAMGEIGFAVIATSLAIVSVFLPIAFMGGIIGRFFYYFGLSVTFAVIISTFLALTFSPMACSRLLKQISETQQNRLQRALERSFLALERGYLLLLHRALRHRATVVTVGVAAFLAAIGIVRLLKLEFITQADESRFIVYYKVPVGTSMERSDLFLHHVEQALARQPEIRSFFAGLGFGDVSDVNEGVAFIRMHDREQRTRSQMEVMADVRQQLAQVPGFLAVSVESAGLFGGGQRNADVQLVIKGPDLERLRDISEEFMRRYRALPGIVDVDSDLELTKPEVRVYIDRNRAADLGVPVQAVASTLNVLVGGQDVVKYKELGERFDVNVRLLAEHRSRPADLQEIYVPAGPVGMEANGGRRLVELRKLVDITETVGPDKIRRHDRMRAVQIYANVGPGKFQGEAILDAQRLLRELLPPGYASAFVGRSEAMGESFGYLLFAFVLSIGIIYLVMAGQFESFLHPFTILLTLPLSFFGAFGALFVTGYGLSVFAMLGVIMMMGLVTKNAILLIDYTNQLRLQGVPTREALLRAGPRRLRPILMTALTTIFGMLPLALGVSTGGESRAPVGVTIIGGMVTATLLTLVVIPVAYSLLDDAIERVRVWVGKRTPTPQPVPVGD